MPRLIRGSDLTGPQKRDVLARFIYRWTVENLTQSRRLHGKAPPRNEPVTDAQWLADHAFWFVNDGSRLSDARAHRYAEPFYLASSATPLSRVNPAAAPALTDHSVLSHDRSHTRPEPDPISKEDRPLLPYRASWLRFRIERISERGDPRNEHAVYLDDITDPDARLVASFWGPSAASNAQHYVDWRKGEV